MRPILLLLAALAVILLLPSCAATGFGRTAPVSVREQGKARAFVWSVLTCPGWWDQSFNPLDSPGPWQLSELRKSPAYWTLYAFNPQYH